MSFSDKKTRFKVNDRVRCKVAAPAVTEGREYTVESASVDSEGREMLNLIEVPGFDYFAFRFDHADPGKGDTDGQL